MNNTQMITEKKMNHKMKSPHLIPDQPLVLSPRLACALGLEAALILQQVHYWLQYYSAPQHAAKHVHMGRVWMYNAVKQWQSDNFPFLSIPTIERKIAFLRKMGLLLTSRFNTTKMDRTLWYSIDYEMLDAYMQAWQAAGSPSSAVKEFEAWLSDWLKMKETFHQNDGMNFIKMTQPIPETTSETNISAGSNEPANAPSNACEIPLSPSKENLETPPPITPPPPTKQAKPKKAAPAPHPARAALLDFWARYQLLGQVILAGKQSRVEIDMQAPLQPPKSVWARFNREVGQIIQAYRQITPESLLDSLNAYHAETEGRTPKISSVTTLLIRLSKYQSSTTEVWTRWTPAHHPSDDEVFASPAFQDEPLLVQAYAQGLVQYGLWRVLKAYKTDEAFRTQVAASLSAAHPKSQNETDT